MHAKLPRIDLEPFSEGFSFHARTRDEVSSKNNDERDVSLVSCACSKNIKGSTSMEYSLLRVTDPTNSSLVTQFASETRVMTARNCRNCRKPKPSITPQRKCIVELSSRSPAHEGGRRAGATTVAELGWPKRTLRPRHLRSLSLFRNLKRFHFLGLRVGETWNRSGTILFSSREGSLEFSNRRAKRREGMCRGIAFAYLDLV